MPRTDSVSLSKSISAVPSPAKALSSAPALVTLAVSSPSETTPVNVMFALASVSTCIARNVEKLSNGKLINPSLSKPVCGTPALLSRATTASSPGR